MRYKNRNSSPDNKYIEIAEDANENRESLVNQNTLVRTSKSFRPSTLQQPVHSSTNTGNGSDLQRRLEEFKQTLMVAKNTSDNLL